MLTKKMLFAKSKRLYQRDPWINNIAKLLNVFIEQAKRSTQNKSGFTALVASHADVLRGSSRVPARTSTWEATALVDRVVANATPW